MISNEKFIEAGSTLDARRSRSSFTSTPTSTLTMNAGELVPLRSAIEVYPGDVFTIDNNLLVRSTTPIAPVMDDLYMDLYWFYVPNTYLLSRKSMTPDLNDTNHSWKAIIGVQDNLVNMPLPKSGIKVPTISIIQTDGPCALLDYLYNLAPLPGFVSPKGVSCLPYLAYQLIWNEWFRDKNTQQPFTFTISSGNSIEVDVDGDEGQLRPVAPFHSYFGSALPWPQRLANPITINLNGFTFLKTSGTAAQSFGATAPVLSGSLSGKPAGLYDLAIKKNDSGSAGRLSVHSSASSTGDAFSVYGSNLGIDLSSIPVLDVNQLRASLAAQHFAEALARSGNTYGDYLAGIFGVKVDHVDGRPELLASDRFALSQTQVAQTTPGAADKPGLGTTGAFSHTFGSNVAHVHAAFEEHGWLLCLGCIRPNDTVSGGLHRSFTRLEALDFYTPAFDHIGEQPILQKEIAFSNDPAKDEQVFGYQEAWAELRTINNEVHGLMRPGQALSYWTYAESFKAPVSLQSFLDGRRFIQNVDQTLQVSASAAGFQFQVQLGCTFHYVRNMSTSSRPGLRMI